MKNSDLQENKYIKNGVRTLTVILTLAVYILIAMVAMFIVAIVFLWMYSVIFG